MSDYKELIDKMRWSYSRCSAYEQCPYNFFLKYIVDDDDQYLAEGNFYAEVGGYVHSILQMIFNGELSIDDAADYYVEHFDENVFYTTRESAMQTTFELCANYFAEADFYWLKNFEILGVEKQIETNIDGYPFIGFIDLLLRHKDTGEIYLIDHKSSAYPFKVDGKSVLKKAENDFKKYKRQMYLYCKAVYEEYGKYPEWICWNHFKDQKVAKIPFDINEYNASVEWFVDTIHAIENDCEFRGKCEDESGKSKEYFYRKNICEFRSSCEYNED